jgi:hypothetical protein
MARILGLLPAAMLAARGGMSANAFYRDLRQQGIAPRRQQALELMKIAKGVIARTPDEPFRPLNRVPSGSELAAWPSKNATGVMQNVTLVYRDRITGHLARTYWRINTPNGITRERALAMAADAYSEHAVSYEQDLIGAIHTSAYRLVPGLVM